MPTRKQRRREQKNRRHEWEYVYVDDEGHEVEVDENDATPAAAKPAKHAAKPGTKTTASAGARGRGARAVEPPSWNRVARRAAIFAPLMLIVVYLLKPKDASPASIIIQVVVLLLFFLPFSYLMDTLMYRAYRKRIGDPIKPTPRKR